MAAAGCAAPGDALAMAMAMAQGSIEVRLDRLTRKYGGGGLVRRAVHFGVAAALVAVAPLVVAGLALSALAVLSCPLSG